MLYIERHRDELVLVTITVLSLLSGSTWFRSLTLRSTSVPKRANDLHELSINKSTKVLEIILMRENDDVGGHEDTLGSIGGWPRYVDGNAQ